MSLWRTAHGQAETDTGPFRWSHSNVAPAKGGTPRVLRRLAATRRRS